MAEVPQPDENTLKDTSWRSVPQNEAASGSVADISPSPAPDTTLPSANAPADAPLRPEREVVPLSPANPPADTSKPPVDELTVASDATPPESSGLAQPAEGGEPKPGRLETEKDEIESYTKGYLAELRKGSTAIIDIFPPDPSDKPRFEGFQRAVELFGQEGKQEDLRIGIIRGVKKLKEDDATTRYIQRWESVGGVVADILKDPASPEPVRATVPEPPALPELDRTTVPEPVVVRETAPAPTTEGERREPKEAQTVIRERAREVLKKKAADTGDPKYLSDVYLDAYTQIILKKYRESKSA